MAEVQYRKMLTRQQTADMLGIPYNTLQFWASTKKGKKKLPYYRIGRHSMYALDDIEKYLQNCRVEG